MFASIRQSPNQTRVAPPPVEVHNLTVAYHQKPVLYGVDFTIERNQLVGIIGPNGAGKSTLIKSIMGLTRQYSGWVKIFGLPIKKAITRIGYIPQRKSVDWDFPVTAYDVVMMGRYGKIGLCRRPSNNDRQIVEECLERVQMLPYSNRQISNLSGGQQQRIFLARALAQESDIYLMDEPFTGVDAATESAIIALLKDLKRQGKTIMVVHHDLPTAKEYFDALILLNMRLIACGPTKEVFNYSLLQKTYGGRLTILSEIANVIAKNDEGQD